MRAYFFGNMYLSSIQQGIQGEHAMVSAFVKYRYKSTELDVLYDWATNHKTSIYLNGGYASVLYSVNSFMEEMEKALLDLTKTAEGRTLLRIWGLSESHPSLPHSMFHEEEASLNGALTSVCVILPEAFFSREGVDIEALKAKDPLELNIAQKMLVFLSNFRLAS